MKVSRASIQRFVVQSVLGVVATVLAFVSAQGAEAGRGRGAARARPRSASGFVW